jgi:hypothetical protein
VMPGRHPRNVAPGLPDGPELTGSLSLTDITIAGQRLCDAAGGASRKIHWPGRNLTRRK